jgi:rhodanese-related sulfurtransferase
MIVKRVSGAMIAAMVLVASGCGTPKTNDGDISLIDIGELTALMDSAAEHPARLVIVDPRPVRDYAAGHIPGAVSLRLPDVDEDLRRPPMLTGKKTIVVYGQDPGSAVAKGMVKKLISLRYKGVRMFAGGIKAWRGAGMGVEGASEARDRKP